MASSRHTSPITELSLADSFEPESADRLASQAAPDIELSCRRGITRRDLLMAGIGSISGILGVKAYEHWSHGQAVNQERHEQEDQEFKGVDMELLHLELDARALLTNDAQQPIAQRLAEMQACLQRIHDFQRHHSVLFERTRLFRDRARTAETHLQTAIGTLDNR